MFKVLTFRKSQYRLIRFSKRLFLDEDTGLSQEDEYEYTKIVGLLSRIRVNEALNSTILSDDDLNMVILATKKYLFDWWKMPCF